MTLELNNSAEAVFDESDSRKLELFMEFPKGNTDNVIQSTVDAHFKVQVHLSIELYVQLLVPRREVGVM